MFAGTRTVVKYLTRLQPTCCTWGCRARTRMLNETCIIVKYLTMLQLTCWTWGCGALKYLRKPRLTCCTRRCRALTPVFTGTWITIKYITRSQRTCCTWGCRVPTPCWLVPGLSWRYQTRWGPRRGYTLSKSAREKGNSGSCGTLTAMQNRHECAKEENVFVLFFILFVCF